MVFKEAIEEKNYINYRFIGNEAEYVSQLRAMVISLGTVDNIDARFALMQMLLNMLPNEDQVKFQ